MPIDPMIARGIEYPDFTRTIALAEEIKNRRETNRLGALDQQMRQQQFEANQQRATQEQEKLRKDQQLAILIPMAEKGNEAAIDELAKRVDGLNPAAGIAFRTDPAQRAEALKVFRQQFGIPAEKTPGELAVQRFPGFGSVLTQGGEYKGSRPDPAPQQYGPESFSPQQLEDGSIALVGNRGTIRGTELRGPQKADSAQVKADEDRIKREQAWDLYSTARDGLVSGLEGATTNPVIGRFPAVTAKQQVAEGGVAAMAPVLKQLFRVSGEGVFTDKDQQLLLDMVPKRTDLPEARSEKIANIDRIVQAKLGVKPPDGDPAANGGGLTPEEQAELEELRRQFGR